VKKVTFYSKIICILESTKLKDIEGSLEPFLSQPDREASQEEIFLKNENDYSG
jgi:hypothetical protein